jgi:hypothetical protein
MPPNHQQVPPNHGTRQELADVRNMMASPVGGNPAGKMMGPPQVKRPPAYPWTIRQLQYNVPFPRCDYSLFAQGDDLWLFGGLGKTGPRNDLVIINSNTLVAQPVATNGELPPPRDGHTSVFIKAHLIVFGGECDDGKCEDSLYLLRCDTFAWQHIMVQGNLPIGRRDHSAAVFEDTMFIFGGQSDGYFLQDLVAFDLNTLYNGPRWEYIEPANDGPSGRAGHSAIVHHDRIYM